MKAGITVSDLTVQFGPRAILDSFCLTVQRSETVALLGPSGCGKSTLLRAVAGLAPIARGAIDAPGEIGLVFQEPRLMPWLNVEKNVRLAARSDVERARVRDTIALVGLGGAAHLLPKALSGGMAQRASLARSLVRSPQVLLLDEPLSALDALARLDLQSAIARIIRETQTTAILVTHDVDEALFLADRVIVLGRTSGTIVFEADIPASSRRERTANLVRERRALYEALGVDGGAREHDVRSGLRLIAG